MGTCVLQKTSNNHSQKVQKEMRCWTGVDEQSENRWTLKNKGLVCFDLILDTL